MRRAGCHRWSNAVRIALACLSVGDEAVGCHRWSNAVCIALACLAAAVYELQMCLHRSAAGAVATTTCR